MYYDMNTIQGNNVYMNNFVSDLSEFTETDKESLLRGEEIIHEEDADGNVSYCSINFEEGDD